MPAPRSPDRNESSTARLSLRAHMCLEVCLTGEPLPAGIPVPNPESSDSSHGERPKIIGIFFHFGSVHQTSNLQQCPTAPMYNQHTLYRNGEMRDELGNIQTKHLPSPNRTERVKTKKNVDVQQRQYDASISYERSRSNLHLYGAVLTALIPES